MSGDDLFSAKWIRCENVFFCSYGVIRLQHNVKLCFIST